MNLRKKIFKLHQVVRQNNMLRKVYFKIFPQQVRKKIYSFIASNDFNPKYQKVNSFYKTKKTLEIKSLLEKEINKTKHKKNIYIRMISFLFPQTLLEEQALSLKQHFYRTIYYDITFFHSAPKITGIQRVVKLILENSNKFLPDNFEICLVSYNTETNLFHGIEQDSSNNWKIKEAIKFLPGDIFLGVDLNYYLRFVIPFLRKNEVEVFVVLYDLVFIHFPQYVGNSEGVKNFTEWLESITINSTGIIAISDSVKDEFLSWTKENGLLPPPMVTSFPLGCDPLPFNNFGEEDRVETQIDFSIPTFISVSTIEPRKGYKLLISSFNKLIQSGFKANLIIVGRIGWKCEDIIPLLNSPFIYWFKNASDQELRFLYKQSNYFIFASEYEGYGLPIVEASLFKLPLILRNTPISKEIAKNNAHYFKDGEELLNLMIGLISKRIMPIENNVEVFCWEASAEILFHKILNYLAIQK